MFIVTVSPDIVIGDPPVIALAVNVLNVAVEAEIVLPDIDPLNTTLPEKVTVDAEIVYGEPPTREVTVSVSISPVANSPWEPVMPSEADIWPTTVSSFAGAVVPIPTLPEPDTNNAPSEPSALT